MADLPESEVIIERLPFNAQEHDWVQEGYNIRCSAQHCNQPYAHGSSIKPGMMLTGHRGHWMIVKEGGLMRKR